MTEILKLYQNKALDSLESAIVLMKADKYFGSVNRSYYAIYYCVEGLLSTHNAYTKSHRGLIRQFSDLFIKTGVIDKKYGDIFQRTFNKRQFGDYDIEGTVTKEDAELAYKEAKEFVEMTENYFSKQ